LLHATETADERQPGGALGSFADFSLSLHNPNTDYLKKLFFATK